MVDLFSMISKSILCVASASIMSTSLDGVKEVELTVTFAGTLVGVLVSVLIGVLVNALVGVLVVVRVSLCFRLCVYARMCDVVWWWSLCLYVVVYEVVCVRVCVYVWEGL